MLSGPMWSNDTQLAVEQAYNYSIPFCDGGATAIPLTTYPNFFRTIPSDTISARAILAMIQSKGWSSAVLMTTTDAYGAQMADAYKQAQNDFGVKIVGPFFYEPVSPYDMVEALTPEQAATYGCKKVLNAVKSTGVGIIIFPVDAYQMSNCFEYADEAGMLTRDFVYFTHDAGTEYMYRFGASCR